MERNLSDLFGPSPECMPLDELVATLDAPPNSQKRQRCEQHLASCATCSTELALYRQFESAQPRANEAEAVRAIVKRLSKDSPAVSASWWSKIRRPAVLGPSVLAAAAVLVLVVVNVNTRFQQPEVKTDDVMRSSQVIVVGPAGEVREVPAALQWRAVAGAAGYKVRILEVDQTELWRSTTASTSVDIPGAVKVRITPFRKLLWEVTATDAAGNSISSSGLQSFVLEK